MRAKRSLSVFLVMFLLLFGGALGASLADHDDDRSGRNDLHERSDRDDRKHSNDDHDDSLVPVSNPAYAETCGACHFAYQPALLPSGSWEKILTGLDDHFGVTVDVDSKAREGIRDYLLANSAEKSSAKRARKVMRSLGGDTPMRITDIPYITEKHHDISLEVFAGKSVGGFSNCVACHTTAGKGIYDDDHVVIPR